MLKFEQLLGLPTTTRLRQRALKRLENNIIMDKIMVSKYLAVFILEIISSFTQPSYRGYFWHFLAQSHQF